MILIPWVLAFLVATGVLVVAAADFGQGEATWLTVGMFATGAALMSVLLYVLAFVPRSF